jgi:hypothetical protein
MKLLPLVLLLCACAGIPDEFPAPKHHECKVWVTDGRHAQCLDSEEFIRWRQRNSL